MEARNRKAKYFNSAYITQTATTMSDFLSRENDILGGEFLSGSGAGPSDVDIDFERAASAFPDISLDGSGDIPTPSAAPSMNRNVSSGFSFDDFETRESVSTNVKVTGDNEIEKFEDQFPDIDVPPVRLTLNHRTNYVQKGTHVITS